MKSAVVVSLFLVTGISFARPPLPGEYPFEEGDISSLARLVKLKRAVSSKRLAKLVRQYGIDFRPTEEYLENLRQAGAEKVLLDVLRSAGQVKQPQEDTKQTPGKVYGVGAEVRPLAPIYKPEPPYSEKARTAKLSGGLVLWIVIDPQGNVADIKEVSEPLGEGLDENAIRTVSTWKFEPPTRNGVPVTIHTDVEISYRLY